MMNRSKSQPILFVFTLAAVVYSTSALTLRRPRLDGRIVGGEPTTIEQIPFQVSLQRGYHFCGGTLIAKRIVITAAHCTESFVTNYTKVRIGSTRTDRGGQLVDVLRVHRHDKYDSYTIDFDYAIWELNDYESKNLTIGFAKLPASDAELADGTPLIVSGWGNTQSSNESRDVLRATRVPKVNATLCSMAYGSLGVITTRMICAGYPEGGKDACQGDSGGPLFINGTLYGVVSWGYGCARPDYPGVYSRVAAVRDWIQNITGI